MATEIGEVGAESIQRTSGGGGWLEQRSRAVQGVRSGWIYNLVHRLGACYEQGTSDSKLF